MRYVWVVFILNGIFCWLLNTTSIITTNPDMVSWAVIGICTIAYVFFISKEADSKLEYQLLLAAYFFRLFLLLWDREFSHIFNLPNSGADSEVYHRDAVRMLTQIKGPSMGQYPYVLKNLYGLFGVQRVIGQYFNVLLGITSIVYLKRILVRLEISTKVKNMTLSLAAFLPNVAIMNAILLRETPMIALLAISLFYFIRWWPACKRRDLAIAAGLVFYSATFHSGSIAPLLGYVICAILYDREAETFRFNRNTIIMLFICAFTFAAINVQYGDKIFAKFNKTESVEDVTEKMEVGAGGAGYEAGISTGNATVDLIVNTPVRVFYFIASPLPWQWRGLNDIIAFCFSAMFYGYCYILAAKALRRRDVKNKNLIIVFLIFAFTSGFIFAWGVRNAGTALRHRDKFVIQYLVLFALCTENKLIHKKPERKSHYGSI